MNMARKLQKHNEKLGGNKNIPLRVVLIMFAMIVVFWGVVFVYNTVKLSKEKDMLDKAGYYSPVSVGDYSLNVCKFGNENGAHRIVAMAGAGVSNFSVDLRPVTDALSEENQVVFVDRAGYGLSDDTKAEQTIEHIVEDYRTALKNAGVEAPYVLLPHSVAGVYATYWVSEYPDEIEGVVFLDSTQLGDDTQFDEGLSGFSDSAVIFLCKTGMYRFAVSKYIVPLPAGHSDEDNALSYALNIRSGWSCAQSSENRCLIENCKTAWSELETTDIPKMYICSSWGYTTEDEVVENMNWLNTQREARGMKTQDIDKSVAKTAVEQSKEKRETVLQPYLDKLGNCELVLLAGDHFIFDQKPEECTELIKGFLDKIS